MRSWQESATQRSLRACATSGSSAARLRKWKRRCKGIGGRSSCLFCSRRGRRIVLSRRNWPGAMRKSKRFSSRSWWWRREGLRWTPPNPTAAPTPRKKQERRPRKTGHGLTRDLRAELQRICGIDLTRVIGLNVLSVLIIISEIGVNMSRWRSAKAFCSWLGLNPGNKISGGRVLSSRTPHVVNRVSLLLRTLATSVGRSETWLGIFHRRMKARLGPAGANTATARKMACLIYHLLKYQEQYIDVDTLIYAEKIQRIRLNKLRKTAQELGFELLPIKEAA